MCEHDLITRLDALAPEYIPINRNISFRVTHFACITQYIFSLQTDYCACQLSCTHYMSVCVSSFENRWKY